MKLDPDRIEQYLTSRLGQHVELLQLRPLKDGGVTAVNGNQTRRLKTFGYGEPIFVQYRVEDTETSAVLHTMAANAFGHERRADRAAGILLSYDTYNDLPQHVHAIDVGAVTKDAGLHSLHDSDELFLLTEFVDGTPYAQDLQRLRDTGDLTERDVVRTRRLAEYLAEIHAVKNDDDMLYRRRIRDLLGSGEGIMGLTDSYPPNFALADTEWLKNIEIACVRWRWHLKTLSSQGSRLSQVHGDFHPFNVLFYGDTDFWVLDRSRGAWGEPADDVSCMAINYLFFSLQRTDKLASPFERLWTEFWDTYLRLTEDQEVLSAVAPFFAWRGLVVASPIWYDIPTKTRKAVFRFVHNVLKTDRFDPANVNDYIR